jgi:O-antigen/teichoic acid export membrane protein
MPLFSKNKNRPVIDKNLLLSGSLYSFLIRAGAVLVALGVQVVLARQLGVSAYGTYIYILTWVVLIGQFSCLGFDTSLVRYISAYSAKSEMELLGGIRRVGILIPLGISVMLALGFMILVYFDIITIQSLGTNSLYLAGILGPLLAFSFIRQSELKGLKHVVFAQVPDSFVKPLILVSITSVWYWNSGASLKPESALSAHIFAAVVSVSLSTYFIYRFFPATGTKRYVTRKWLVTSIPLLLASAMTLLMSRFDILMIGWLISPQQSGIYAVASQFAEFTSFGLVAANTILAPMISGLYTSHKYDKLQSVITMATRLASAVAIIIVLLLLIFGKNVISIFGQDFVKAYIPLCILLIGQAFNVMSGSVGAVLNMTGHESFAAKIIFLTTMLNIILNLIFIPRYGINGAAIATTSSLICWNIVMVIYIRRKLSVNTTIFA